jgi:uncharacterized protein YjbJ (UPF0337 family)
MGAYSGSRPAPSVLTFPTGRLREQRSEATEGEATMEGKKDDIKGRVKEAAGDLTDDDDLKREGKTDRTAGSVKDKFERAKDKGEEFVDKAKDRLQRK